MTIYGKPHKDWGFRLIESPRAGMKQGFSLVELLVVIGIIAMLISILLPALARARQQAEMVECRSNMRQVGLYLLGYANQWKGAMFPPRLGDNQPQTNRWPVYVFDPPVYNPPIMLCPSDLEPAYEHSYILNAHIPQRNVTYSNTQLPDLTPSDVIVMGEKVTSTPDYYMDPGDYVGKVEFYRHGAMYGSNYLFLDLHVDTQLPRQANAAIDPWDPVFPPLPPPPES